MLTRILATRLSLGAALVLLATSGLSGAGATGYERNGARALSSESTQAAGDLDPTFGNGGEVTTDFFGNNDGASAVAIQPDGKIVVAGSAKHGSDSSTSDFALSRYNQDGTLDQTFGSGGKQTTDFFGQLDVAYAVAIQTDGKIVLVGLTYSSTDPATVDFALARYNADGSLDQGFGSGGKQTTDFFGGVDAAYAIAIQGDGRLVVAGYALHTSDYSTGDFALARYNPDGTLDQSFGSGGKQTTDFFGNLDSVSGLTIQPDGKIVAAGYARNSADTSTDDFALARYNQDGALDQTFGSGGKQTTDFFGHEDAAEGVTLQADGKILLAGQTYHGDDNSTSDFALARYNPDGTLDQGFASGGRQTTDFFGALDSAYAIAVQSDGKIALVGTARHTSDPSTSDFALARYNQDGSLDQSFGSAGKQTSDFFGNLDGADGVAIQPDGKIVLAGIALHTSDFSTGDFALARYNGGLVAPDFSISFNPASLTTQAGTKVAATLLINRTGGFSGNVTVTPPGPSGGIKPKPPDPVTITGPSAVFKTKVGGGVGPGSYSRIFTATDDSGRTRTATVTIVVQ